jgi:hypothetical protein
MLPCSLIAIADLSGQQNTLPHWQGVRIHMVAGPRLELGTPAFSVRCSTY